MRDVVLQRIGVVERERDEGVRDRQSPNVLGDERLVGEVRRPFCARRPLLDVLQGAEDDVTYSGFACGISKLAPDEVLLESGGRRGGVIRKAPSAELNASTSSRW